MIFENHGIALNAAEGKRSCAVFVFNRAFNPMSGKENILDIFVFSEKYHVIEWVYGFEAWDDNTIEFPYHTYMTYERFVKKVFNINLIIVTGTLIPEYIEDYVTFHEKMNTYEEKDFFPELFSINFLKIQLFLNYMDTDSFPFYMKNIGVLYNQAGLYENAFLWLKKAYRLNRSPDIRSQLIISLTGLEMYKTVIRFLKEPENFLEMTLLAHSNKLAGNYDNAVILYKKALKIKKEEWILKDIKILENEINKKN